MRKIIFLILVLGMLLSAFSVTALGADEAVEAWPQRAVNLIVPASAGGGTDNNARLVAKYLTEIMGQPVNVVNIKGGAGVTGCTEALNAENDGYTLLYYDDNVVCNYALGAADFNWNDFDPCGRIFEIPFYLVSTNKYATLEEMINDAKANPNTVMFAGEAGAFIGMLPHVMNKKLDIELKIVDGGQMAERLPLMISNQVQLTFAPMSQVADYFKTGDLNLLCTFGTERVEAFPEIPTAIESGLNVNYLRFQGILAPKGTNAAIVEKISTALSDVSQIADFQEEAAGLGLMVDYGDTDTFCKQFEEFDTAVQEYVSYIG